MSMDNGQEPQEMNCLSTEKATQNPEDYIGRQVAGVLVVSAEEMPALSEIEETKGDYIVDGGILGKQEKAITYAHPKHLKTMLELWKALCIATGKPFFDYQVKQGAVLYIGMEDTLYKLSNRVTKMKKHFPPAPNFNFSVLTPDQRNVPQIESLIKEIKPNVVILDPLTNLLPKEDKKEDADALLKQLDGLIVQYGISIILIHHARKGSHEETMDGMRGSSVFRGWADTNCRIDRVDSSTTKIKLEFESRHAMEELDLLKLKFNRQECSFAEDAPLLGEIQKKIREKLRKAGGEMLLANLKVELEDEVSTSTRTIERAIKDMVDVMVEIDPEDRRKRVLKLDLSGDN